MKQMIALDSPRWNELKHAYGSAKDTPGLIKAIAKSDPAAMKKHPHPWSDVYGSLCHQYSYYPATYAAIPHLVSIAENSDLDTRLQVLILCGTIKAKGVQEGGPVPQDLIEPFESAMAAMSKLALASTREAVSKNLLKQYPLPYLIQAILALHFGAYTLVHAFASAVDNTLDVEAECPECETSMDICIDDIPDESLLQSTSEEKLEKGLKIVSEMPENEWTSDCLVPIAAGLAKSMGDEELSKKVLKLYANTPCSSCDFEFEIADALI